MARSSILGAERAPSQATGRDVESLGPSDTSDSGSEVQGELDFASPEDLDHPIFGTAEADDAIGLDGDAQDDASDDDDEEKEEEVD